jgi:hypothetical protein
MDVAVAIDRRPGKEILLHGARQRIVGDIGAVSRHRPEIDHAGISLACWQHHGKADPTQPAIPRLQRAQGKGGRDGGVGGIASGLQDRDASLRGLAVLRDYDPVAARRDRLRELPMLSTVGALERR